MVEVLKLEFSSFNKKSLQKLDYIIKSFNFGFTKIGPISLPTKKKKFCVLRSPFKHKDSREHIEIRFCKDLYLFKLNTKQRAFIFLILFFDVLSLYNIKNISVKIRLRQLY